VVKHGSNLLVGELPKRWHDPVVIVAPGPDRALHPKEQRIDQVRPALRSFDQFGGVGRERWESPHPALTILAVAEHAVLLVDLWPGLGQHQAEER
jgi:hypothetical protein